MNSKKNGRYGKNKYRYYKRIRKDGFGEYKTVPYSRRLAIKYYCMECVCFIYEEMKNCTMPECPLFPYRFGKLPKHKTSKDRVKAIRTHCRECVSDDLAWIRECPSYLCPSHPFRLGVKTDTSSLMPVKQIESVSDDEGVTFFQEKRAV